MNILNWISAKLPGVIKEYDDRLEIEHHSGEHSTIWKSNSAIIEGGLVALGDLYLEYDGMDLFSSTFKVASKTTTKSINGVVLVDTFKGFAEDISDHNPVFPEEAIPFMYQAGIGIYAIGIKSGQIYEWDDEAQVITEKYCCLDEIFDEWLDAVS